MKYKCNFYLWYCTAV